PRDVRGYRRESHRLHVQISACSRRARMASYEMSAAMRRPTLATMAFLPLRLLTGCFGKNFERMWSVNGHSDRLSELTCAVPGGSWIIAPPVMAVVLLMCFAPDLKRVMHSMQTRILAKKSN
ncbi:hypothetical protein FB451DRAFT_1229949, partial [Mycena latifolia]